MIDIAFDNLLRWREHPSIFVREVFGAVPDPWQERVLEDFPHCQRQAMQACKGPGKTTCLSWLSWNFLLTRPHPKIAATSITGDNLRDCLWTEMALWQQRSPMLQAGFEVQKERIFARDHPETWWMSARTWPKSANREQQANTLAGLHADYLLFLLDEAGGIPESVSAAAKAALSTGTEVHIVIAGNPTHLEGTLYRAVTVEAKYWTTYQISGDPDDPNRATRVSVEWARQMIEEYGREHPYVLVNVFGKFPPGSFNTLLGPDDMAAAMKRAYREHDYGGSAKVLGIDVAGFGDDSNVMFPRQGIQAFTPQQQRNIDSIQGAGWISRKWQDWDADACFVDDTGGWGHGWVDQLGQLGRRPIGILFGANAHDRIRMANKRVEMYFDAAKWIKEGGALPPCPELTAAFTQTTYTFERGGDRLILEPKEFVKTKIGYSPDHADAFVLTFAEPVSPRARSPHAMAPRHTFEYDPFPPQQPVVRPRHQAEYDPFGGR